LIADLGDQAAWRYVEFFIANIRNPNTRRAYARTCVRFSAWCDDRGLTLTTIRPFDIATYIEALQQTPSVSGVKHQRAAVPMLFDWLITGQIMPSARKHSFEVARGEQLIRRRMARRRYPPAHFRLEFVRRHAGMRGHDDSDQRVVAHPIRHRSFEDRSTW
jgi:Phage integrase, N-terminal SAM-like domain